MEKNNRFKYDRDCAIQELAVKYRKECPLTTKRGVEYIVNRIYNSQAPKFYITCENAQRHLMQIKKNKPLNIQNELKIKMYNDLYTIFINYLNDGMKIREAVELAVNSKAPSFYVDKNTIFGILYKK